MTPTVLPQAPSRTARTARVLLPPAVLAGAVLAVVAFDPVDHHVPLCPFHAVTGMWCPFCGGLRAVYALAHLDVRAALGANLLLVVAIPFLAVRWWRGVGGRPPVQLPWRPAVTTAVVITLVLAFGVLRNLPVGQALAPR